MTDEHEPDPDSDDGDDADDSPADPDLPGDSKTASEGGKVLTPDELNISDSEYVEELDDDGRYVVSPGGGPPNVSRSDPRGSATGGRPDRSESTRSEEASDPRPGPSPSPSGPRDRGQRDTPVSPEAARTLLAKELARADASYGIDIVARFEGETVRHRTVSNDVVGTFETLVRWYARHVTDDTPVDEVVEILLSEADFGGGSEPNLAELLETHGLDSDDSIADLVEAITAESRRG